MWIYLTRHCIVYVGPIVNLLWQTVTRPVARCTSLKSVTRLTKHSRENVTTKLKPGVGIVQSISRLGHERDNAVFELRQHQVIFIFSRSSTKAVVHNQPIQCIQGLFPGGKVAWNECSYAYTPPIYILAWTGEIPPFIPF